MIKIFLLTLVLMGARAHAACGISIVANDLNLTWDFNWGILGVSISVSKTDPAECTFGLGFSKGGAGSYTRAASKAGGGNLRYQLYQDAAGTRVLKDVPDVASANEVIMVTLPAGSNPVTQMYYFDIPFSAATTPTLVATGAYTDSFIINAYEGPNFSSLSLPPDASTTVNVNINVPKMVDLALVDTGGVFQEAATSKNIEFGNLTTGKTARFDMVIRTNAGYSVSLSSSNNGRLKHTTKNSFVNYTLSVNNVNADLSGATPVITGSGSTTLTGLNYPVRVVIGNVGALALAGPYEDTVTITTTATD